MGVSKADLYLVGRVFETDRVIPRDEIYLLKYFDTPVERAFIRYYLTFRGVEPTLYGLRLYRLFQAHTGHVCDRKWAEKLESRVGRIEAALAEARAASDLARLSDVVDGKVQLSALKPVPRAARRPKQF